jgi:putative tricarboxylic transport membrane protein
MNKAETAAGAVVVAVGAFMMVESMNMLYMANNVPGPGFLPRLLAIGLIVSGLILTVKGIRPGLTVQEVVDWPNARGWRRVGLMVSALAVALLVLDWLGFLVTTAAFMLVVVYGLGSRSWRTLISMPLVAAIGLYIVFAVWLQVPLPRGIITFFE